MSTTWSREPASQSRAWLEWWIAWKRQSRGTAMEGAVHPVLGEVGEHEDLEHLERERLALDRAL